MYRAICFFGIITLFSCSKSHTDFDYVCDSFNELNRHPSLESLSPEDRFTFINKKVIDLPSSSNARKVWELLSATTDEKYSLFKQAADEVTGNEWSCISMEELSITLNSPGESSRTHEPPPGVVREKDAVWSK